MSTCFEGSRRQRGDVLLEALFGVLYLYGRTQRINELFVTGMEAEHAL